MSHPLTRILRAALLLSALGTSSVALAADPFAWTQGSPEEQLAADPSVIPLGKGALFVPSLTNPSAEPPVILVNGNNVTDVSTGVRVMLDPGTYTVIVSPGSPGQGVGQTVLIREGETTLVPVRWGALRINVTDEKRVPFRGQYDLIAAEDRETMGTGFGADTLQGEQLMTWLLEPGVYRIVRPGANYRNLRDYATVYVPASGLVRYRLVVDKQSGAFLGSGMMLPGEFGAGLDKDRRWSQNLVLGADGSFVQSTNRVGVTNQTVFSGNLFIDHQLGYHKDRHHVTALLQAEAGATSIRPTGSERLPILKSRDGLRADILYNWFARDSFGPYVRAGADTRMFKTNVLATQDTTFIINKLDGSVDTVDLNTNDTLKIAGAWAPSIFREGAGMNYRALNGRWITFNARLGLGMRQNLFQGSFLAEDDRSTQALEYTEVGNFYQQGVEATLIMTARLPGWAVYATDLEIFSDFQEFDKPSLEWRNTFTIRLTRIVSLNYFANVDYLPQVVDNVQLEHSVVVRASWTLL